MRFWSTLCLILVLSTVGLTYEIAAGRVLAPYFGTSLVTWTAVIATVLAGFSLGNALGGFAAETEPRTARRQVQQALIGTALLMALTPTVLLFVYTQGARGTGGMVLAVFLAFFPASVLVSLPSPWLARRAVEARPGREGSSLGLVLAAGSVGAILGAVLAGFVTLPLIGSAATFTACGAAVLACLPFLRAGDPGPRPPLSEEPGAFALVGTAALLTASLATGPVCRYESGLSCIDIVRQQGTIRLFSDRTLQAAEHGRADDPALVMPYAQWIAARLETDLGPAPEVLFIGGGGYTLPARLVETLPDARAVAIEIDPLVTRVAMDHLPMAAAAIARHGTGDAPRLDIVHADGRVFLNDTDRRFDAVVMDAFSSASVPAHLATRETYARLREISGGPVYVNLIDAPKGRLARGMHAILTELYPSVTALQGPVSPRGRANLLLAASRSSLPPLDTLPEGYTPVRLGAGRVLTDNRGWTGHR